MIIKIIILTLAAVILIISLTALWTMTPRAGEDDEEPPLWIG